MIHNIAESNGIFELEDIQSYLKEIESGLSEERIEECYERISNPFVRINDKNKKWVAYVTKASEDETVVKAMREILAIKDFMWIIKEAGVIKAVDEVGEIFQNKNIKMKHRIPFYVLVLDKLI